MTRRSWVLAAVGLVAVTALGTAFWMGYHRQGESPNASDVTVDLVLDPTEVKTFVREHDGKHSAITVGGAGDSQVVAGTVTVPKDSVLLGENYYSLFVIDQTDNDVAVDVYGLPATDPMFSRGWDGRYNELAEEYPWLASVASRETGSGWTDPGTTLGFGSDALNGPLRFAAWLRPNGVPLDHPDQLTIGLAAWDDQGDLQWAVRLGQPDTSG